MIVETPSDGTAGHARDIATLTRLLPADPRERPEGGSRVVMRYPIEAPASRSGG